MIQTAFSTFRGSIPALLPLALLLASTVAHAQVAAERSTVLAVTPAQVQSSSEHHWLSLGVMNEVSIALWRSQLPRALPANLAAHPTRQLCEDFALQCLASMSNGAQEGIAKAIGADFVVLPRVRMASEQTLTFELLLQDRAGKLVHAVAGQASLQDMRPLSIALAELLGAARAKAPHLLLEESSLLHVGRAPQVRPQALQAHAAITREDWQMRFAAQVITQAQDELWAKKKLAAVQSAIKLDPDYYPAWNDLAWVQLSVGDNVGALSSFERSKALHPQGVGALVGPAFVLSQDVKQVSRAIAAAQPALSKYPQYGEIWNSWLLWLANDPSNKALYEQQIGQARKFLDSQALRFNIDLALQLAWTDYNADRNEQAVKAGLALLQALSELYPEPRRAQESAWARAQEVVARAYVDLNKSEQSLPHFESALLTMSTRATADPALRSTQLPDLRLAWARALYTANRPAQAKEQAARAAAEYAALLGDTRLPRAKALTTQARWSQQEKDFAAAQAFAQESLNLLGSPANPAQEKEALAAFRVLTASLESQKKLDELPAVLERRLALAIRAAASDVSELAAIYRDMGDNAFARKDYEAAISAFEKDIAARGQGQSAVSGAVAFAWGRIARSNEALQRYELALSAVNRAIAMRVSLISLETSKQALINVVSELRLQGTLYGELSRYQEALQSYELARAYVMQEQPLSLDRQAQSANAIGWALRKLDRNPEAITQYELALKLWEQDGDKNRQGQAIAAANLGVALSAVGRHADSLPLFERSLAIRRQLLPAQHLDIAQLLNNMSASYLGLERNSEALRLASEALTMVRALRGEDHVDTLNTRERIAVILDDSGQVIAAEREFHAILALREKLLGRQHSSFTDTLESLAGKLRQRGQNERALALINEALQTNRGQYGEQHSRVASNLTVQAAVLENLGRYAEALLARQAVLSIRERIFGAESMSAASARAHLGTLYLRLGDTARAQSLLESALTMIVKTAGENNSSTASILITSGNALYRGNLKVQALERYERALKIHTAIYGQEHPDVAKDLGYIAEYYLEKKDYARALPMLERANAIDTKLLGPMHASTAASLNNLAANYYAAGQEERSLPLVLRAALIAQENGNPDTAATYLMNLARNYHYLQQKPAAIIFGKQAINMLQKIRSQSRAMDAALQKSLLQSNLTSYRYVADLLTQEGRLAEAQEVLSMLKEEEYFEYIRRDASDQPTATLAKITPAEAPWLDRYQQIGADIARIARELGELRQTGDATSAKARALEADLAVANSGFDRITSDMFKAFKDSKARQLTSQKIEAQGALQETLGELGEGVSLVQYLVLPSRVGIILTTAGVQIAREALISEEALNRKVAAYREAVFNPAIDPMPLAQELYQLLMGPISKDLADARTRVLMLSLDGTLRYLPFAALHDGERFLVEKTQLALYSDAARDKLKDKAKGAMRVWGLGLTKAVPGFSALGGVRSELDAIVGKQGVAGQVHFDEAFTEQALQSGLAQKFPVLHIASHFKFAAGTEADSFLLLGDGSKLSLKDVRTRVRFSGVDLLTLSACETAFGGGQDANGREIEGFATLAQNRGAKSVLASLWPVSDASTSRLMQTLYSSRDKEQLSKAAALQKAQLSLLKGKSEASAAIDTWRGPVRAILPSAANAPSALPAYRANPALPHAHPYYWAPFILMGNWL